MIANPVLALAMALLAAAAPNAAPPSASPACAAGGNCPDTGIDVTLPDAMSAPAPNVRLTHFSYTLPGKVPGSVVSNGDVLQLEDRLKNVAATTLARGGATYGVRMRYVLTADKPAEFHMQVAQAPPGETPVLKQFYAGASALKDFHSAHGVVLVDLEYDVTPAAIRPAH